jgi:hypothetical protein
LLVVLLAPYDIKGVVGDRIMAPEMEGAEERRWWSPLESALHGSGLGRGYKREAM